MPVLGFLRYACLFLLLSPGLLAADYSLGILSFDLLQAAGPGPGVNFVNLSNFTGGEALPPDFPILTPVVLEDAELTVVVSSGSQVVSLGDVGPGLFSPPPELQFASDVEILALILSATLNPLSFVVDGEGTKTASSGTVLYQLLPSAGTFLVAGVDFGVIPVSTSDVPEPGSWLLTASSALLGLWRRKKQ